MKGYNFRKLQIHDVIDLHRILKLQFLRVSLMILVMTIFFERERWVFCYLRKLSKDMKIHKWRILNSKYLDRKYLIMNIKENLLGIITLHNFR